MKYLIYFFQHRFAHTINVDFFTDLVEVFNNLIANDQLDYRQCLYAIQVVLIMLSGQGEALNIDPLICIKCSLILPLVNSNSLI